MLVIFDLDGTLYSGDDVFPDAINLVNSIEQSHGVVFLSNTSSKTSAEVSDKLRKLGFNVNRNVYTSSSETIRYLVENKYDTAYVIGSESFKKEILANGIEITDKADTVVVGLDFNFSSEMLDTAISIILNGGTFIACNEDKLFPSGGKLKPGLAMITGAIEKVVSRAPNFVVGKPNTYMIENVMSDYNVCVKDVVIVGDSEESDILTADRIGCVGILVLDGYDHFLPVTNYFGGLK